MISTAEFKVEDSATARGLNQLNSAFESFVNSNPEGGEGYSGYVLVAIPLKNGTWCPASGVVTGYINLPSLASQDVESGRRA